MKIKSVFRALTYVCIFALPHFAEAYGGIQFAEKRDANYACTYKLGDVEIAQGNFSFNSMIGIKANQIVHFSYFGKYQIGDSEIIPQAMQDAFQSKGINLAHLLDFAKSKTLHVNIVKHPPIASAPVFNSKNVVQLLNGLSADIDGSLAYDNLYMKHTLRLEFDNSMQNLSVKLDYFSKNAFTEVSQDLLSVIGSCVLSE